MAGEPVVVTRYKAGTLRAFRNVCRHLAEPIAQGAGCKHVLNCAYHRWTYKLDCACVGHAAAAAKMKSRKTRTEDRLGGTMPSLHDLPSVFGGGPDGAEAAWFFVRAVQTSLCLKKGGWTWTGGGTDQQPTTPLGYWQSKGHSAKPQDTPEPQ